MNYPFFNIFSSHHISSPTIDITTKKAPPWWEGLDMREG